MIHLERQKKIISLLAEKSLDCLIVRKKENIAYLTGTKGEDAILFISPRKKILVTDGRYKEEYVKNANGCSVRITNAKENAFQSILHACIDTNSKIAGFESGSLSYQGYINLKKYLGKRKRLVPVSQVIESIRMIKDEEEIRQIRQACKYGCQLMNYGISALKSGLSENKIRRLIEIYALRHNIQLAGFDIIVASGRNASMPHASPSGKVLGPREMVIIDLGANYRGYNSDLTRTAFLGKITPKYLSVYEIVLDSQSRAIENLKPGVYVKDIDNISRRYISDKGMGRFFFHSLGHGIGLETHEIPAISQSSQVKLEKGMVITIEPGIYIHGWGGVRIEDTVLITENGCEVLTKGAIKYAGRN